MIQYQDSDPLAQARQQYFTTNQFGDDGGYGDKWIRVRLGPLPLALPNLAARVRAVRLHDLHHIATGYATDWRGEAEIAAWEIANGLGGNFAGWMLDLQAWALGLFIAPRAVFRAFLRGRQTWNLYGTEFSDELLAMTIGELRHQLWLDRPVRPPFLADRLSFAGWSSVALLWTLLAAPLLLTLLPALGLALACYARLTEAKPNENLCKQKQATPDKQETRHEQGLFRSTL